MTKRKHISYFPNDQEAADFEAVRLALERNSNSDTVRAMVRICKKILAQKGAIAPIAISKADIL